LHLMESNEFFWWVSPFRFFHNCDLHSMERQIGNAGKNCLDKSKHDLFFWKSNRANNCYVKW
jgi:hypothetical protein